jgi:hypothetical protein
MIIYNEGLLMTKEGKKVFFRLILFLALAIFIKILSAITFSSTCFGIIADSFVYPVGDQNTKPTESYNSGNGYIITQDYRNIDGHTGVDLANGYSGGIVRATAAGKIVYKQESSSTSGWGYMVRVEHTLLSGEIVYSQYGHMLAGSLLVDKNDEVDKGQTIGQVGSTGVSTGNHLHFEIKKINYNGCGYIPGKNCKGTLSDEWDNYYDPLKFIQDNFSSTTTTEKFSIGDTVEVYNTEGVGLNLREGAGLSYSSKITMPDGTQMIVYDGPEQADNYTWWGLKGYVSGTFYDSGWAVEDFLKKVTGITSSTITHTLTPPAKTEVSQGGVLEFTVEEKNNSNSYYAYYVQIYVKNPKGITTNSRKISTYLRAGEERQHKYYLLISSSIELGVYTFGVKVIDTSGNLIDNDSFEFTVVSGTSYAMRRSARKLKRLMRNPDAQVVEEDGWKVIIVPERNR